MSATAVFELDTSTAFSSLTNELLRIWKNEKLDREFALYSRFNEKVRFDSYKPSHITNEIAEALLAHAQKELASIAKLAEAYFPKNSVTVTESHSAAPKPTKEFVCELSFYLCSEDNQDLREVGETLLKNSIGDIYYFRDATAFAEFYVTPVISKDTVLSLSDLAQYPPSLSEYGRYIIKK